MPGLGRLGAKDPAEIINEGRSYAFVGTTEKDYSPPAGRWFNRLWWVVSRRSIICRAAWAASRRVWFLYSQSVISKRLSELEVTKKNASADAFQAQRADVQFRVQVFLNCPPPLGILNVPLYKLNDVDEFSITLERCNRTAGHGRWSAIVCDWMGITRAAWSSQFCLPLWLHLQWHWNVIAKYS